LVECRLNDGVVLYVSLTSKILGSEANIPLGGIGTEQDLQVAQRRCSGRRPASHSVHRPVRCVC
jgi:hypothetical protein